jgi:hypothetical protein
VAYLFGGAVACSIQAPLDLGTAEEALFDPDDQ